MRTHMLRNSLIASALVCAFAAVPLSQAIAQDAQMQKSEDNQTVPDKAADAWITTKVKSELATAKNIKASDINVDTSQNVVTLSGTVATKNEKNRAVKLAKSVKGVKSVEASGLTVSAMTHTDTTSHSSSDMPASNASAGH
jgi:hyperosmotically inducible periplasmic protein